MVEAAAAEGMDRTGSSDTRKRLTSIKRAGAWTILTYYALEAAARL